MIGFLTVVGTPPTGEMGALFVEPQFIGEGCGAMLWNEAVRVAQSERFTTLTIDSDPDAEGFYRRMGAVHCSVVPSASIPDRWLPQLRYELA